MTGKIKEEHETNGTLALVAVVKVILHLFNKKVLTFFVQEFCFSANINMTFSSDNFLLKFYGQHTPTYSNLFAVSSQILLLQKQPLIF